MKMRNPMDRYRKMTGSKPYVGHYCSVQSALGHNCSNLVKRPGDVCDRHWKQARATTQLTTNDRQPQPPISSRRTGA